MIYKKYFKLIDFVKEQTPDANAFDVPQIGFFEFFKTYFDPSITTYVDDTYTTEFFQKYFYTEMAEQNVDFIEIETCNFEEPEITPEQKAKIKHDIAVRFVNLMNQTRVYYSKMLSLLKENENKLLNAVENSSFVKFNDTPQSLAGVGFNDDDFASTTTKSTSNLDENIMIKLNRIRDNYIDYNIAWLNRFKLLIMY